MNTETDICKVIQQFLDELKNSKQLKIDNESLQNENNLLFNDLEEYKQKYNTINEELNKKKELLNSILENTTNISKQIYKIQGYNIDNTTQPESHSTAKKWNIYPFTDTCKFNTTYINCQMTVTNIDDLA